MGNLIGLLIMSRLSIYIVQHCPNLSVRFVIWKVMHSNENDGGSQMVGRCQCHSDFVGLDFYL